MLKADPEITNTSDIINTELMDLAIKLVCTSDSSFFVNKNLDTLIFNFFIFLIALNFFKGDVYNKDRYTEYSQNTIHHRLMLIGGMIYNHNIGNFNQEHLINLFNQNRQEMNQKHINNSNDYILQYHIIRNFNDRTSPMYNRLFFNNIFLKLLRYRYHLDIHLDFLLIEYDLEKIFKIYEDCYYRDVDIDKRKRDLLFGKLKFKDSYMIVNFDELNNILRNKVLPPNIANS